MTMNYRSNLYTMSDLERMVLQVILNKRILNAQEIKDEIKRITNIQLGETVPYHTAGQLKERKLLFETSQESQSAPGRKVRAWAITPKGIEELKKSFEFLEKAGAITCSINMETLEGSKNAITIIDRTVS